MQRFYNEANKNQKIVDKAMSLALKNNRGSITHDMVSSYIEQLLKDENKCI